ncbi:hypothetical protein PHJA_000198400 [Phtheirospermum japonicum]|uniref:Uncharacterized protein n=1 Tax=Phtheirospermum japonicum TaxID=374723 RepID=A0A830AZR0_9LAMI|nr:hypothetical protein PHJA_000198400 [Phtheirospermum japonicum]
MALQWLSLVAIIWLQSINGTNSNFPAYSSHLKNILSISQLQLNTLASASDAGKLLGWISGVAARRLPLWIVLLIGSTLGLVGYGVQYLFLAGNSICWINTVCYVLAIHNFPLDRQIAVGLSTSYVGLSAKIYTALVDAINGSNNNHSSAKRAQVFLLLSSIAPLVACVLASPLARDVSGGESRVLAGGFLILFVITVFTGLFAVITSLGLTRFLPPFFVVAGLFVFLLLPLVIPLAEKIREKMQQKCSMRVHDVEGLKNNNCISVEKESYGDDDDESGEEIGPIEEIGTMLMLKRVEFWLYFFAYLFGATLGLVYLNNLGQIAESRGCSGTSSLVSLSSAFGFFGRLLPSLLFYFFSKKKWALSTMTAMGAMMAPMCGAFSILLVSGHDIALYIATTIIGICTGAITSISVSTTTELFGAKNFGVNHNIVVLNIPIGSFLFGNFSAFLYNRGVNGEKGNCVGHKCYQTTFMIWGFLSVLGTLLAMILHSRTKKNVFTK